jgi:CDP-6-deoxy-D-xylo-4-hexulose-3-dehydrase
LKLATSTWNEQEKQAILDVLSSGQHTMGEKVREFEEVFAKYIGTRYAVMVNSGSSANLLMVAAWTLRYGKGSVIVPVLGWSTSYSPFQQYGWKLKFVDVDKTLNIDPQKVWENAQPFDVVLAINVLGNPCEFSKLPHTLLEDNCESLGATYKGKKTGSFGVMASHSFFFSHHICTMEGGMITTDDRHFYELLLSLRSHGWTRHWPEDNLFKQKVEKFRFVFPGYNVRPIEMMAAVGLKQMEKLDQIVAMRRMNAENCPIKLQKELGRSSWYGFAVKPTEKVLENCETRPVISGNFLKQPVMLYYDYEVLGELEYIHEVEDMVMIGNSSEHIDWSWAK